MVTATEGVSWSAKSWTKSKAKHQEGQCLNSLVTKCTRQPSKPVTYEKVMHLPVSQLMNGLFWIEMVLNFNLLPEELWKNQRVLLKAHELSEDGHLSPHTQDTEGSSSHARAGCVHLPPCGGPPLPKHACFSVFAFLVNWYLQMATNWPLLELPGSVALWRVALECRVFTFRVCDG